MERRRLAAWFEQRGWRLLAPLLALATLLVYAQVAGHQFLLYDDDPYVTSNAQVRSGLSWTGARWALTALAISNWHPLTWLSHMLDVQLFGLDAGAHHLVSAALHAANAALLLLVLARMTSAPWRSAFVAALFALHPLHVESVAWIAERKDVLSTLLGFLMLGAYARYAARPGPWRYLPVVLCFAGSLLAKPMWVTAPFLLLLLDLWPLQRVARTPLPRDPGPPAFPPRPARWLLAEKLPLLALSAASSVMTVVAQERGGALAPLELVGFGARLANALVSYARYLELTFWPGSLAAFYPYAAPGPWAVVAGAAGVLGVTAAVLWRARRSPWLALGWCWFLGTLVPVIGLVQVGVQGMADRYTYLPIIGVFIAVTWEVAERAAGWGPWLRGSLQLAAVLVLVTLAAATWRQTSYWSDQETLFRHAVAVTEGNGRAQLLLAQAIAQGGRFEEAVVHARAAVELEPTNARAHKNLGYLLYKLGRVDEAIAELQAAVFLQPDYAEAHGNLGIAYGRKGWTEQAMQELALELRLRSRQPQP